MKKQNNTRKTEKERKPEINTADLGIRKRKTRGGWRGRGVAGVLAQGAVEVKTQCLA